MIQLENEVGDPRRLAGPLGGRRRGLRGAGAGGADGLSGRQPRARLRPELRTAWEGAGARSAGHLGGGLRLQRGNR
jgi:hypothetical protein